MNKRTIKVSFIFIAVITIISVLLFSHIDCAYICEWSIQLMDHFLDGTLSNYAYDLNAIGIGVNYSLFSVVVNSVFLLPVYIIGLITPVDLIVFEFTLKLVMIGINIMTSYTIYQICLLKGKERKFALGVGCLFLLSPFVQIFSVGMGQIEGIAVLLVALSIKSFLSEKYYKASIFAGISLLFKTFAVFIIIPVIILYFRRTIKSFLCVAYIFVFYIVDKILSYFIIPGFFVKTSATNSADFISRVFDLEVNNIYIYLGIVFIICAICLYLNIEKKVTKDSWYNFSLLFSVTFFVCVKFSIHWMVLLYMLLVIGIAILYGNYNYKLVLLFGVNFFTSLVSVIGCVSVVTAIYPGRSLFSLLIDRTEEASFVSARLENTIEGYEYAGGIATTLLIAMLIMYVVLTLYECRKKESNIPKKGNRIYGFLIPLNVVSIALAYGIIGVYYYV